MRRSQTSASRSSQRKWRAAREDGRAAPADYFWRGGQGGVLAPAGAAAAAAAAAAGVLPPGWQEAVASDGRPYYYNASTRETRWDPPAGPPPRDLAGPASATALVPAAGAAAWRDFLGRGWPFAELHAASLMEGDGQRLFDVALIQRYGPPQRMGVGAGGAAAWAQAAPTAHGGGGGGKYGRRYSVHDEAGCTRRPPLAPARFETLLGATSLGSGGDRRRLCAAYASLFGEIVPSLESMSYVGLQWGAAELAHLAESLPLATALSHLSLEDNVEIDDDALELLVPALAAPGHAIRAVELSGTMATEAARRGIDRRLLPERCAAWEEVTASDGRVYYHDKLSGKTSWDRPAGGVGGKTPRADKGDYDHLFVVMVAGERGAGKTALIRRFVEGKWLGGRAESRRRWRSPRALARRRCASRAGRCGCRCGTRTATSASEATRRAPSTSARSTARSSCTMRATARRSGRRPRGCGRCGATRGPTPPPRSSPPRATRRGTGR